MKLEFPDIPGTYKLLLVLAILAVFALVASSSLFSPGFFTSHEGTNPIQRVVAISYEIRNGFFYPRWLSLSYYGMGSPFSNFYSPGFYLAAAYLNVIGVPLLTSIKLICGALFFIGALGMFIWTRRIYGISGALLSSVLYLFAPYHFVDIYVRGAMSEFSALAFLPFLFFGIDISFTGKNKYAGNILVAVSSSLILLCHHLSALLIAPFAIVYFGFSAYHYRTKFAVILQAMTGFLMGVGLSAFYWLPVILERKYLKWFDEALTSGYYSYVNHFVHAWQLVSTFWGFGGSGPGPADGMSFQIGLVILIFVIVAIFAVVHVTPGAREYPVLFLFLGLFSVFLTTELSSWIYEIIPWLAFIQFPWRFLGPATLFLSAFAGLAVNYFSSTRSVIKFPPAVPVVIAIGLCLVFSVTHRTTGGQQPSLENLNTNHAVERIFDRRSLGALCEKDEYLPIWVSSRIAESAQSFLPGPVSDEARIGNVLIRGAEISFNVRADNDKAEVTIPWFYFPGWKVHINGRPAFVAPDGNGFLTLRVPKGRHAVVIRFGSTVARSSGWYATLATLCIMAGCLFSGMYSRLRKNCSDGEVLPAERNGN